MLKVFFALYAFLNFQLLQASDESDLRNIERSSIRSAVERSQYITKALEYIIKNKAKGAEFAGYYNSSPTNSPNNASEMSTKGPFASYDRWIATQNTVSAAALAQLAEERKKAEAQLEQQKLEAETARARLEQQKREAETARALAEQQVTVTRQQLVSVQKEAETRVAQAGAVLATGGANYSNAEVNEIVTGIASDPNIVINTVGLDDTTQEFVFDGQLNNSPRTVRVKINDQAEYNRLKIFIAFMQKMHSAKFDAASAAMGSLITHILASAQPQSHHLKQTAALKKTAETLDGYLVSHVNAEKYFNDWHAMPFSRFLSLSYTPAGDLDVLRGKLKRAFDSIVSSIPRDPANGNPLGSEKLEEILLKIKASIELPVRNYFTEQSLEEVMQDLGLFLKTDNNGIVEFGDDYYEKFFEVYEILKKLADEAVKKKQPSKPIADAIDALVSGVFVDSNVVLSNCRAAMDDTQFQSVSIAFKRFEKEYSALINMTKPSEFSLSYQDGKMLTDKIKSSNQAFIDGIRNVLFIFKQFVDADLLKRVTSRIVVGDVDPVAVLMLNDYYGPDFQRIKAYVNNHTVLPNLRGDYDRLKRGEKILAIKLYLDAHEAGTVRPIDILQLKQSVGVPCSAADKIRANLIFRSCQLLMAGRKDSEGKLISVNSDSLNEDQVGYIFSNLGVMQNPSTDKQLLLFALQKNLLANESDQGRFLNAFLAFSKGDTNVETKLAKLKLFFDRSLAEVSKNDELVKKVSSLSGIKADYEKTYRACESTLRNFVTNTRSMSRIAVTEQQFPNPDEKRFVSNIVAKIQGMHGIAVNFDKDFDDSSAVVLSGTAAARANDEFLPVTAGLPQLAFVKVCGYQNYYGAYYSAAKILHYLELEIPTDDDMSVAKSLIEKQMPAQKDEIIRALDSAKELRNAAINFYKDIIKLLEFIKEFKTLKDAYDTPGAAEAINFYERLIRLTGISVSSAAAAPLMLAPPPPPPPGKKAPPAFLAQIGGGGKAPPPPPPPLAAPGGAVVPSSPVLSSGPFSAKSPLFGDISAISVLPFIGQNEMAINKQFAGSSNLLDSKYGFYKSFLDGQISYFKSVDLAKLAIDENNDLDFVAQLMNCIDLYLKIKIYEFSNKFSQTPGDAANVFVSGAVKENKSSVSQQLKKIKEQLWKVDTAYTLTKLLNVYKRSKEVGVLDETNKLLRNLNPDLRKIISDAVIQTFDTLNFSAAKADVITPIFAAIDTYVADKQASGRGLVVEDFVDKKFF
jgi:hypothetical protein